MRTSVVTPLAMGGLLGIAGAVGALWCGLPVLLAFLAYSLCGAVGVLLGGMANMAAAQATARVDDGRVPAGSLVRDAG